MKRPGERSMHRLPVLEGHRGALEKCVYCPKLCRSACPVSNAEPRETLTPWGKMSMSSFAANGSVPMEAAFAKPAWACTGCHACRESCDHRNDVPTTLFASRSGFVEHKVAPEAAVRTSRRFAAHARATRSAVRELSNHASAQTGVATDGKTALLVGCAYARALPAEARAIVVAASSLLRERVSLLESCCGLPLLHAGDMAGFARQAHRLGDESARFKTLLVADAGCGQALRSRYPQARVTLSPAVELLIERAAREIERLECVPVGGERVRYHDACQLGRGLGLYDEPRAVLARALGRAPDEFFSCRQKATCSGAGGLLPTTFPEVAKEIAKSRMDEHERSGGGRVVTSCASSLLAFRRQGARVDDLSTWIARAVPLWP